MFFNTIKCEECAIIVSEQHRFKCYKIQQFMVTPTSLDRSPEELKTSIPFEISYAITDVTKKHPNGFAYVYNFNFDNPFRISVCSGKCATKLAESLNLFIIVELNPKIRCFTPHTIAINQGLGRENIYNSVA